MREFQGRVVSPGKLTAKALVSRGGLNTLASFQKALQFGDKKATCGDQNNPDLYGKEMAGKALCLPRTIGSTTGGLVLYCACSMGRQPACMLFSEPIDSLAAAGADLLRRREEHKILIVFSDGLPNDMVSGRAREGVPDKYIGDAAIQDTCLQVRTLRRAGVHVIGIFLGGDGELENERMIYGSSFLRIRRAEDFGGSAGKRLSETLLLLS